ncbi:N-acetyltransferase family protein [Streptomyces sp. HUAS ZL42]|uniref:GNAT family N-acetyltransferase n=1 Tax=Streptomyces sp. HUAS ZL42 TaxID=3231715 RepID=UPI00345EBE3B
MAEQEVMVRRARAEDIPGLVASSAGLFAEDGGTRDPSINADWPREHGAESFAAASADGARLVLVAEREGRIVGHLTGSVTGASAMRPVRSATLIGMHVRPEHRRAGAGGTLVGEFLAWAGGTGAGQVEVAAYSSNTDAIRFCERNGFAPQALTLRRPL